MSPVRVTGQLRRQGEAVSLLRTQLSERTARYTDLTSRHGWGPLPLLERCERLELERNALALEVAQCAPLRRRLAELERRAALR